MLVSDVVQLLTDVVLLLIKFLSSHFDYEQCYVPGSLITSLIRHVKSHGMYNFRV